MHSVVFFLLFFGKFLQVAVSECAIRFIPKGAHADDQHLNNPVLLKFRTTIDTILL